MTKYVVVLGSLLSGLGKGIVTASVAKMLCFYGLNVAPIKFDGYLNYDCGTMNPFRHGEVFVLNDKSEVDMDFGIYERFLNRDLTGAFSITGGKIFSEVISKERRGEYLGRDVQIIPHVTDLIIQKINDVSAKNKLDVAIIEVGGTVGDIENSYFIEAMRQLSLEEKVVFITLTYIPELSVVGEQKTKPTQIAIRNLMQAGIQPNFIVCRSQNKLNSETKSKIALFANLPTENIIDDSDIANIYYAPLSFIEQKLDKALLDKLEISSLEINKERVEEWILSNKKIEDKKSKNISIAIVGKYMNLKDSYTSVKEALLHSAAANNCNVDIKWIESELLEAEGACEKILESVDGMIVPGGFGSRGIEGMINAIQYARYNKTPYLGICLGMQLMAVEFARNVCGLQDANSSEFDKLSNNKVIDLMDDQKDIKDKGSTMRLGEFEAVVALGTYAHEAYGAQKIYERHRHRYEFNNNYRQIMKDKGLVISATTPDDKLVEMIEWKDSFGIGTQSHPELKSRLERPSPLFVSLVKHSLNRNMLWII